MLQSLYRLQCLLTRDLLEAGLFRPFNWELSVSLSQFYWSPGCLSDAVGLAEKIYIRNNQEE